MSLKDKLPFNIVYIELANSYEDAQRIAQEHNAELPTQTQLGELATYVYNYDSTIRVKEDVSGIAIDTEKAAKFLSASPRANSFSVWSRQESNSGIAYYRFFYPTATSWGYVDRTNSNRLAVCIKQIPVKNVRDELDSDIKKWMEELNKRYE